MSKNRSGFIDRAGRPANWSGAQVSLGGDELFNKDGTIKDDSRIHGYVTKKHPSTIVRRRKRNDGKIYEEVVGSTHQLDRFQQSKLIALLNSNKTKEDKKIYIVDTPNQWTEGSLVNQKTGEVIRRAANGKAPKEAKPAKAAKAAKEAKSTQPAESDQMTLQEVK